MKIKIFNTNNANIHATRSEVVDVADLGFTPREWMDMSQEDKMEAARQFVDDMGWVETWFEEEEQ